MSARRALIRPLIVAGLVAVGSALAGCASHVDSVDPGAYIQRPDDGWYRIQSPSAHPSPPAVVLYPQSCKYPSSVMGGPESC